MKIQSAIPAAVLALSLAATGAVAKDKKQHKQDRQDRAAAAQGLSVSGANAQGAVAGGLTAAEAMESRRGGRQGRTSGDLNAAQTNSSGAIYTTRRSAAAAVNTNGSASGTGSVYTGSTVDAYGETNRQGSNADIYGNSEAEVTND